MALGQSRSNDAAAAVTGSEKSITILVSAATLMSVSAGVVAVTSGAASTTKPKTASAVMLSGGSIESVSVTDAAATVSVQTASGSRAVSGFRSTVFTLLAGIAGEGVKATGAMSHSSAKVPITRSTFSEKLTVILAAGSKLVSPSAGDVAVGAASILTVWLAVLEVPPSPSLTIASTVLGLVSPAVVENWTARSSASVAAGVAAALKSTRRAGMASGGQVASWAKVPITVPSKVTSVPETPI